MRYPLRVTTSNTPDRVLIVDSTGKIIFNGDDSGDARKLARFMVWSANWRVRLFGEPQPYGREDWMRERVVLR